MPLSSAPSRIASYRSEENVGEHSRSIVSSRIVEYRLVACGGAVPSRHVPSASRAVRCRRVQLRVVPRRGERKKGVPYRFVSCGTVRYSAVALGCVSPRRVPFRNESGGAKKGLPCRRVASRTVRRREVSYRTALAYRVVTSREVASRLVPIAVPCRSVWLRNAPSGTVSYRVLHLTFLPPLSTITRM